VEDAVSQDARNEAVQRHKRSQVLYGAMTPWWYACAWSPCPPLWRLTQPPPAAQNLPQSHHGSRGNPRSNDRMHPLSRAVAPISHTCAACWAWRRLKPELTSAGVLPTCISSSHGGDSSRPVFLQTGKSQAHMRVSLRTVAHSTLLAYGRRHPPPYGKVHARTNKTSCRCRKWYKPGTPEHGLASASFVRHGPRASALSLFHRILPPRVGGVQKRQIQFESKPKETRNPPIIFTLILISWIRLDPFAGHLTKWPILRQRMTTWVQEARLAAWHRRANVSKSRSGMRCVASCARVLQWLRRAGRCLAQPWCLSRRVYQQ